MSSEGEERESVGGVTRILVLSKVRRIMDALTPSAPQLTLQEITVATGLPATTCHRLVTNLVHEGFLERVGDHYRIGLAALRWGSLALEGRSVLSVARPILDNLRDETGESSHLCIRDREYRVMVAVSQSKRGILRLLHVGEVLPLHVGSTGKVFLAFDSDAPMPGRAPYERYTAHTIVDSKKLAADIKKIRLAGYSVSWQERDFEAVGITAPVIDRRGRMIAAVGVSGPLQRMEGAVDQHVSKVLTAAAAMAEQVDNTASYDTGGHDSPLRFGTVDRA
ncbi:MAG: IclR family transcriptional regulator [Acidimicrobiales bacterium]